jgi:addiction module HigA family antidote
MRRWSEPLRRAALRKLLILDAATELRDLTVPPGNRLEKLSGGRSGQHSIRINDQWRICSSGRTATHTRPRSSIITEEASMGGTKMAPIHPGEILLEEFLEPLGLSQYRLAQDTSAPPRRINEIVHGKRSITADTALRLARYFGTSDLFWLNLQTRYDLEREKDRLGTRLDEEVVRRAG